MLVNLADYRKLNVPLLEGLSRLLELLSSWFNVTLGEKLLDYLQKWAEPDKSQAILTAILFPRQPLCAWTPDTPIPCHARKAVLATCVQRTY